MYILSWYIEPRYNGTWLYIQRMEFCYTWTVSHRREVSTRFASLIFANMRLASLVLTSCQSSTSLPLSGQPMDKPWLAGYAAWGRKGFDPCLGGHIVHGVCIFGIKDIPGLLGRKELFANKFHLDFQPLALDCLEEWLYNRTVKPVQFDTTYYKRLPFIYRD